MNPKQKTTFYRRAESGKNRMQRDPYIFVISGQVALCLLAVLLAFVLRDMGPAQWKPMGEKYLKLLTRPMDSEEWGWTEGLGQWYTSWKERTLETVSDSVETLLAKRDPSTVNQLIDQATQGTSAAQSPESASSTQMQKDTVQASTQRQNEVVPAFAPVLPDPAVGLSFAFAPPAPLEAEQLLRGTGGWLEQKGEMARSVPQNCSFAPIMLSAQMRSPVGGEITSSFGWREHPLTGNQDFHRGLDIAAAKGTGIRASLPGTVEVVGESEIYGNFITLLHSGGLRTTYAHCDMIKAREGEFLRAGELVATVGNTGISTGPHLHFELSKKGVYYNPIWGLSGVNRYGN